MYGFKYVLILQENFRATKFQHVEQSLVSEYSFVTKHLLNFDTTKVSHRESNYNQRLIKESQKIHKCLNNFNKHNCAVSLRFFLILFFCIIKHKTNQNARGMIMTKLKTRK